MRRSNKYPGMYPKPGILSYLREQNHVTVRLQSPVTIDILMGNRQTSRA